MAGLQTHRPDAVFNLFEGTGDQADNEAYVAGHTGMARASPSPAAAPGVDAGGRNKHLTKNRSRGAGLPTAPFVVVEHLPVPERDLRWPLIVKPTMQDGRSVSIRGAW